MPDADSYARFCAAELAGLSRYAMALTGDRQAAHDVLAERRSPGSRLVRLTATGDLPEADATDDEIASAIGCSTVTVRSHLSRGLAALRVTAGDAAGLQREEC